MPFSLDAVKPRAVLACTAIVVITVFVFGWKQSSWSSPPRRLHPITVWNHGKEVPWPRVTERDRIAMTMKAASEQFSESDRVLMGHVCVQPVFLQRKRPIIVLTSVPGSGNFWTRYLIEQMTGVYSGSIYAEKLSKTRMGGGTWSNASVVVVKAHSLLLGDELKYEGAILLLRNPFDAAKAEFSREATGNHREAAALEMFKKKRDLFKDNVAVIGGRFEKLVSFWIGVSNGRPVHIVYFEDLVADLKGELQRIANFLNMEVPADRFQCIIDHRQGVNKRSHSQSYKNYDPFDKELTRIMNSHIRASSRILPRVAQYLRSEEDDNGRELFESP
eukprot:scpid77837/ scgid19350/ WSC domain-containing protein 1